MEETDDSGGPIGTGLNSEGRDVIGSRFGDAELTETTALLEEVVGTDNESMSGFS